MLETNVAEMKVGDTGIITEVALPDELKSRLFDLGLHHDEKIHCIHVGPKGSPIALWVKQTVIALRKTECVHIHILIHA